VRRRIKTTASPAMVVACIAVVLAMTGSAFAARALITGDDIKDGSITRADLSGRTVRSLKGRRGPAGPAGQDGFVGAQGPQGSTGPQGERGPQGPAGPLGPKGTTGDTGDVGPKGDTGEQGELGPRGDTGPQGDPGQALFGNPTVSSVDAGTPLALTGAFSSSTDGVELSNGGVFLSNGDCASTYKVDVFVSFVDPAAADAGAEYGVARLFLSDSPLDGVNPSPNGGNSDADTLLVTSDVPDDGTNAAQASGSFLVTPGCGVDEFLTLRGAVRTAEPEGANVTGHLVVTKIG
jgi:hypothetical protein